MWHLRDLESNGVLENVVNRLESPVIVHNPAERAGVVDENAVSRSRLLYAAVEFPRSAAPDLKPMRSSWQEIGQ